MDDEPQLSAGILKRLLNASADENYLWEQKHVIQLLSLKKISNTRPDSGTDRYRLVVSDGAVYTHVMLATQLTPLVEDGLLNKNTVVEVEKLTCNMVQNKRLLIFLTLSVVKQMDHKIGEPSAYMVPGVQTGENAASPSLVTPPASGGVQNNQPARIPPSKSSGPIVMPIEALSPYQNKWTIRVRVVQKSDVRQWSNQKGEGRLFNVTFMDESGEISATGFNQAVDDFYDKLQEGKTYYVSKARVGIAKKRFTNVANEFDLSLSKETTIEECTDPAAAPQIKYHFVSINDLESAAKDSFVDVIGVVQSVSDVSEITTKTGKQLQKRELTLVDMSQTEVRLTLWGKQAENYQADDKAVLAFKGLRVGEFNGRSLSMVNSSLMAMEPDIPESHVLRGWYDSQAGVGQPQFKSFSGAMTSGGGGTAFKREEILPLQEVRDREMGSNDQAEYFHSRATIMHIKADNVMYPACRTEKCNKKVTDSSEGWRCEKCNTAWEEPDYRYMLSMSVADYSGQAWFQGFNEAAEVVFGMKANDLNKLRQQDENQASAVIVNAICQTFNFVCQAKMETYNDSTRVRYGIRRIQPLNYLEEARAMRDLLKRDYPN